METSPEAASPLSDEWCAEHFDYLAPEFAAELHPTLSRMRAKCPVTHSDAHGGYWMLTRYADVLAVVQDWETFSSALGVGIPHSEYVIPAIPEHIDPPIQRLYKKLISAYFTPAVVRRYEDRTRELVTTMIDAFVEDGQCDFMGAFAQPYPGLSFMDLVLNAPASEVKQLATWAQTASLSTHPDSKEAWKSLGAWINGFIATRRREPAKGDVVDAILGADIDGRPVTELEITGMIILLIMGGLETTAGALGHFIMRFSREPQIPQLLRERPEIIPDAVEELLRLEGSFISIGRTTSRACELDGHPVGPREKVMASWAAANRDPAQFPDPDTFDPFRTDNRHLAFGAGPHRCVGSNLARMNLRIAVQELVTRLHNITVSVEESAIPFHNAFNRSPLSLPITFTPGPRLGATT